MNLMTIRRRRAANKGFNLIEAAIVLGIVGLVVGGIWVAATSVYANLRSKQATDDLLSIAQGVKALYATQSNAGNNAAVNLTTSLATVFPSDMLRVNPPAADGDVLNPWNAGTGDAGVLLTAANAVNFVIYFGSVPQSACVDFVSRNGAAAGLTGVSISAVGGYVGMATVATAGTAIVFPVTPVKAATLCTAAQNKIFFTFNLKG